MKPLLTILTSLPGAIALSAEITVPEGFCYFGELPQPTQGVGSATPGRYTTPVYTHGTKPDLVVLANGRLWYYINESKPGKILFSEPIELKSAEGGCTINATRLHGMGNNKLCLRLSASKAATAQIVGQDVPVLQITADRLPEIAGETSHHAMADFDGDGVADIVMGGAQATTLHSARGTKHGAQDTQIPPNAEAQQ